ncbi:MAG: response regulator transcription factor, partial [Chloroflexi bacterium]|nr:response regulator transcription factor [Chloroflexota bacterium]
MKVLVIDDNQLVSKDISFCLVVRYPDVSVVAVDTGAEGLKMIESEWPDVVIASSSLPDMAILDLVSRIRDFSDVPLIILSSEMDTDMDRARGLETGADEYITTPFSPMELLARVKALLRRTQRLGFKQGHVAAFGGELSINFDTHEVSLAGKRVKLTPIEYQLLVELVRNEGRVLTHRVILEKVWGAEYGNENSSIKKYIYRLRSKLE